MKWDLNDLVTTGDIARRFRVRASTVSMWGVRYEDFPAPLVALNDGNTPLYSWRQVKAWEAGHEWTTKGRYKHRKVES